MHFAKSRAENYKLLCKHGNKADLAMLARRRSRLPVLLRDDLGVASLYSIEARLCQVFVSAPCVQAPGSENHKQNHSI